MEGPDDVKAMHHTAKIYKDNGKIEKAHFAKEEGFIKKGLHDQSLFYFDIDYLYVKVTDMYIIHNTILYPNKTINLVNKNYNFLNGNCTINSNNFSKSNIMI